MTERPATKTPRRMGDSVAPLELLAEEVENEDDYVKLNAYKRVRLIAEALGPEATEASLLPFLLDKINEPLDDEPLLVLARELGSFLPLVRSPEALLPLMASLAGTDETVVRDAAVASVIKILAAMPGPSNVALELFRNLMGGEFFTSKQSAALLYPHVYSKCATDDQRELLRSQLDTLLGDDTPVVRKALAAALPDLVRAVSLDALSTFVLPVWKKLVGDDQDIVRVVALEATVHMARGLAQTGINDQIHTQVVPTIHSAVEDRSWRARQAIAKEYAELSRAVVGDGGQRSMEALQHDLLPGFVSLLQDNEAEVRAAACKSFAEYCDIVGPAVFVQHLVPCAHSLAPDTVPGVRIALATATLSLAPKLGQELFVKNLMPLLERFLIDPNAPDTKVRLAILQRLDVIGAWLPGMAESFLPIIVQLRDDENWRVRKAVVEALPVLAEHMGLELFESRLLPHYFSAFKDRVCEVRLAATASLRQLAKVAGGAWTQEKVLPRIKAIYDESTFYLIRLAVLQALKALAQEDCPDVLVSAMLSLMITGTQDKTPNVRFTAAQALARVSQLVDDATVSQQIRPCLVELVQNDADMDVKYYAQVALDACG